MDLNDWSRIDVKKEPENKIKNLKEIIVKSTDEWLPCRIEIVKKEINKCHKEFSDESDSSSLLDDFNSASQDTGDEEASVGVYILIFVFIIIY